jgi:hypothetical protein
LDSLPSSSMSAANGERSSFTVSDDDIESSDNNPSSGPNVSFLSSRGAFSRDGTLEWEEIDRSLEDHEGHVSLLASVVGVLK